MDNWQFSHIGIINSGTCSPAASTVGKKSMVVKDNRFETVAQRIQATLFPAITCSEIVIQRVEIPTTVRKESGYDITDTEWDELGKMIDTHNKLMDTLDWYHGTSSSSLLLALMSDGELVSAGDLLKKGLVPLSGESGNALHPRAENEKGSSGVDLKNLPGAIHYTKPQNPEGDLAKLYVVFSSLINSSKKLIATASGNKDGDGAVQQVRMASVQLARFVWSAHLYAPQNQEVYKPMIDEVISFNVFLQKEYEALVEKKPQLAAEIENLVDVFNNARANSLNVAGGLLKGLIDPPYPVIYAAPGKTAERIPSSIPGESLLHRAHLQQRTNAAVAPQPDNQIRVIFVPLARVESTAAQLANKFSLTVLPIELIHVYHLMKHSLKAKGFKINLPGNLHGKKAAVTKNPDSEKK